MSAPRLKRYEQNYCLGCGRGESIRFTMPTDLAAGFPVHEPSGMICHKYLHPDVLKCSEDYAKRGRGDDLR